LAEPIEATHAADLASSGAPDTSAFHALSAGKIRHPADGATMGAGFAVVLVVVVGTALVLVVVDVVVVELVAIWARDGPASRREGDEEQAATRTRASASPARRGR
jgi:hypothetical protein